MVEAARRALHDTVETPEDWALGLIDGIAEGLPLELLEPTEHPEPGDIVVFSTMPKRSGIAMTCYSSGPVVELHCAIETGKIVERVYGPGEGMRFMSIKALLG